MNATTKSFLLFSTMSTVGVYEGESLSEALNAMSRDAGYSDYVSSVGGHDLEGYEVISSSFDVEGAFEVGDQGWWIKA